MHFNGLDLNLLVVFEAIYTQGSLTRAAQQLHLTQPAVSHALARLRSHVGDPLFLRQKAAMVPTPRAHSLAVGVRQALAQMSRSLQQEEGFDPGQARRPFRLGLRDVFEAMALPALLELLRREAPLLEVASVRVERRDLQAELTRGSIDLALDVPLPLGPGLHQQRVGQDRLVVLARSGHPALSAPRPPAKGHEPVEPLSLDDYLAQPHVLVSSRREGWGLEDLELHREGLRRHIALRCQHYFAACRVVSQTDLLLTMPEQYARMANAQFGNRLFAFPLPTAPLDVHMIWHDTAEHDPANRWLRQALQRALHGDTLPARKTGGASAA